MKSHAKLTQCARTHASKAVVVEMVSALKKLGIWFKSQKNIISIFMRQQTSSSSCDRIAILCGMQVLSEMRHTHTHTQKRRVKQV